MMLWYTFTILLPILLVEAQTSFQWERVDTDGYPFLPRSNFGATTVDGVAYLFGGEVNEGLGFTQLFDDLVTFQPTDLGFFTFTEVEIAANTTKPSPRSGLSLASGDSFLVSIGGTTLAVGGEVVFASDAHWIFDLATSTWMDISESGPSPRVGATVFVSDGIVYVQGGLTIASDESALTLSDFWMYDPAISTWTILGSDFTPRSYAMSAVVGSNVYIYGGLGTGLDPLSSLVYADLDQFSLTTVEPDNAPNQLVGTYRGYGALDSGWTS